jgi:hypothetical protein
MDAGVSRAATATDANSDVPTLKNAFDSSVITVSSELRAVERCCLGLISSVKDVYSI